MYLLTRMPNRRMCLRFGLFLCFLSTCITFLSKFITWRVWQIPSTPEAINHGFAHIDLVTSQVLERLFESDSGLLDNSSTCSPPRLAHSAIPIPRTNVTFEDSPPQYPSMPSVSDLCAAFRSRTILFVGPETTYHLHTLFLSAFQNQPDTRSLCLGPSFCTFHHICQSSSQLSSYDTTSPEPTSTQTARYIQPPTASELSELGSVLVRYSLSSTLYTGQNSGDLIYNLPHVDESTGVRIRETWWRDKAKKADVLVLHRAPEPAPAWTYTRSPEGNWEFLDYMNGSEKTQPNLFGKMELFEDLLELVHTQPEDSRLDKIVKAALRATLTRFIPSLLSTLGSLQSDSLTKDKLVFWHESWYHLPSRIYDTVRVSPRPENVMSNEDILSDPTMDPWSLYYNIQVLIHRRLLPAILPCYGIIYLPLPIPVDLVRTRDVKRDSELAATGRRRRKGANIYYLYSGESVEGKALLQGLLNELVKVVKQTLE